MRKPNGEPYLSGTEWEYEDAVNSPQQPQPQVLVYRRTEKLKVEIDDPELPDKLAQSQRVEAFFAQFRNTDSSLKGGINEYATPSEFKTLLSQHLQEVVWRCLQPSGDNSEPPPPGGAERQMPEKPIKPPTWKRPPYPGLHAFTPEEAAIFFGREGETNDLVARLRECQFLAVIGASGTGRSSLVNAGLRPRLAANAIDGSKHWRVIDIRLRSQHKYKNPFLVLANALLQHTSKPIEFTPEDLATHLENDTKSIIKFVEYIISNINPSSELILFIDQFEELFTDIAKDYQDTFVNLLADATVYYSRVRVIVTLREDFQSQALQNPKLAELLQKQGATYLLGPPRHTAFNEIIRKPAELAGIELEDKLIDGIINDVNMDTSSLPLVAFCLREVYNLDNSHESRKMTFATYQRMGGLHKAISERSKEALEALIRENLTVGDALKIIFSMLVTIRRNGKVIRRRTTLTELDADHNIC